MANIREETVNINIPDVGTAVTVCIPITPHNAGELKRVTTCLGAAISGADSKVVVSKNATVIGTIVVAYTSSAAGDIDYLNINGVYLASGDFITIANGGESTGTATGVVTLDILR